MSATEFTTVKSIIMGLFSSGKSSPEPITKVWKTDQAFLKGIVREALLSIKNSETAAIVTVFEEDQREITAFLESSGVLHDSINSFSGKDAVDNVGIVHVIDASQGSLSKSLTTNKKINFLFSGRYPYLPVEKKLIDQLRTQFPAGTISFCLSLDDPFFKMFGATNLKPLMETLGMKDDEFIEHKMVSKAISNAMEKLEKKITTELKAKSEREWFEKNVKGDER